MRVAVISDIHSNLPALEAVLAEVDREAPDELWCLGDIVGYGPQPNECVDLVQTARRALAVREPRPGGARDDRHRRLHRRRGRRGALDDRASSGEPQARVAARAPALRGARGRRALPRQPARPGLGLRAQRAGGADQHPRDDGARRARRPQPRRARARLGRRRSSPAAWRPTGTEIDLAGRRWLLNPGSVGQPRDGDPRAAWLLLDDSAGGGFRRVPYPIEVTQAAIRERGLPDALASRLAHGI